MKVAIYCRVSTDDKGQDPQVQLEKCKSYCNLQGHDVVESFIDEGITGDSFYYDRPSGSKLDVLIQKGKIEGIVCFSIDRFSRQNPMKILPLLNSLRSKGIVFLSVTEPIFNMESEFAEPMRYMLAWFSSYFLVQHKKKVNAGLDKARQFGTKSGKAIGKPRKADYDLIRTRFNDLHSVSAVARELNVSKGSVHNALKNI